MSDSQPWFQILRDYHGKRYVYDALSRYINKKFEINQNRFNDTKNIIIGRNKKIDDITNYNTEDNVKPRHSREFRAGLFGGMFGVLFSHPVDTFRIRILSNVTENVYKNLYKGVFPPLIGVGLEKLLVFGNHEWIKNMHLVEGKYQNIFLSGMMSGALCCSIVTPVERFKINYQAGLPITNDITRLYKGLSSTLIREVPGYGIYFGVYEYLKHNTKDFNIYTTAYSWLYGGISGASAWAVIYPSDVVKTNMQLENNKMSLIRTINHVYKKNGIRGFYRGFNAAILRAFMLHSGVFCGYELYMKYFI